MGAWGMGSFDNDAAGDWLAALEKRGTQIVEDSLLAVANAEGDEYVDADAASEALAAAEVVAAMRTSLYDRVPEEAATWCKHHDAEVARLTGAAISAVHRVLASSELAELWAESGDAEGWRADVGELLNRLLHGTQPK